MATYIVLGNFTDQGIRAAKNFAQIRQGAEQWVSSKGGRVISNYITFGPYDFVLTLDLPSDEVALEGALTFGAIGNTRSVTMRAFSGQEAEAVAARIP
jgi:uncharacterized protein with GYD domain